MTRYLHYQRQLGVKGTPVPEVDASIPEYSGSANAGVADETGLKLIPLEQGELRSAKAASDDQETAAWVDMGARVLNIIPNFSFDAKPFGVGTGLSFGGSNLGAAASVWAEYMHKSSAFYMASSARQGKLASFARREQDVVLQNNIAAKDIMQIDKQSKAAKIRVSIADQELRNHSKQVEQSKDIEQFLRDKYTNEELYDWTIGQISGVYFQSYQLAYDLAKRAERAYLFELGLENSTFVQFGAWDNLRGGLLAGEKLQYDLHRLEAAFLDQNRRELELTKHISLALLDPDALIKLRELGSCMVDLPELLFDLDCPGHYMRRLKSVSLSIPCVAGPYTGVHCTLTLLSHRVRKNTDLSSPYAEAVKGSDSRFTYGVGAIQSIVTSSALNDGGLFDGNPRDERYLPFEGAGAISSWRIELPTKFPQFDYRTITDVILHLRYTARDGGGSFRQTVDGTVQAAMLAAPQVVFAQLISAKHQFPTEWYKFLHPATSTSAATLTLPLAVEHFPFRVRAFPLQVGAVEMYAVPRGGATLPTDLMVSVTGPLANETPLPQLAPMAAEHGVLSASASFANSNAVGTWLVKVSNQADAFAATIDDVLLVFHYVVQST